jgi:Arc/MetJ-type ribon-helix-helix transcriptional regulator
VKVSISLPDTDVEFLDSYAHSRGISSRSAAMHEAVGLLRTAQLGDAYEEAWDAWDASDDADAWEPVTSDGLGT